MSDRTSFRALNPEGVPDGDYVVTVSGGHVTGLTAAASGGGSGSVAVEDEGVEVVAAASRLNFTGSGVAATDAGPGEVTVNIPGGGGAGSSVRDVDDPADPTWGTASAYDAEFDTDGTALPTGWSWVNQGTSTWEKRFGWGILTPQDGAAATSDNGHRLLVRAAPVASTWELSAKVSGPFPSISGWTRSALVLRDSTTGKYIAYGYATYTSFYGIHMNYWSSPGVFGGTEPISNTAIKAPDSYFRIRKTGASTYDFDISFNGVAWYRFLAGHNLGGFLTPDQIGILSCRPSGSVHASGFKWLRVR